MKKLVDIVFMTALLPMFGFMFLVFWYLIADTHEWKENERKKDDTQS